MKKLAVNVFGIAAELTSPDKRFLEFVGKNYFFFPEKNKTVPNLKVQFSPKAGRVATKEKASLRFVGGGVYAGPKRLFWENEFGFRVLVKIRADNKWDILAYHNDLLKRINAEAIYKNYQRSMRWIMHFPIFVLLRMTQGKYLMHASAVEKKGKALVFLGLNKVGKSTLAAFLAKKRGYRFMTDNFLLHDSKALYGFPECLRLDQASLKATGINDFHRQRIYGKHHINFNKHELSLKAVPHSFFLITRGEKLKISRLDSRRIDSAVKGINDYLREFPEYSYLAFLPLTGIRWKSRAENNSTMFKKDNCFDFVYPNDWKILNATEVIEQWI